MVPRPYEVIDPTGPTLFRPIELHCPTVLLDEADLVSWEDRRDILAVINAGHTRTGQGIPRCVGDENEVRMFKVWAPLAYAMIKKPQANLPAPLLSRSIVIQMERIPPGEPEPEEIDLDQGFEELRRKCARWTQDHLEELRGAKPTLPVKGRRANCWRPLVAIADLAGGDWPKIARAAAEALCAIDPSAEMLGVQLLADTKRVFSRREIESIWTEKLLEHLHARQERPWCEYGYMRKPITARQLAELLRPFKIVSRQVKQGGTNRQGYNREQFAEAWRRYVLPA
jgi:hypothetical protein